MNPPTTRTIIILLTYLTLPTATRLQPRTIFSPSGRQIPLGDLEAHIPTWASAASIPNTLFEITGDRKLIGQNFSIQLPEAGYRSKQLSNIPHTIRINGLPYSQRLPEVFLQEHGGISLAHLRNGRILSVWGRRLNLIPVAKVTNLLINIGQKPQQAARNEQRARPHNKTSHTDIATPAERAEYRAPACSDRLTARYLEVAIAFDNSFCAQYGHNSSTAITAVRTAFAAASRPFSEQTCIRLTPVYLEGHCNDQNDPYTSLKTHRTKEGYKILDDFTAVWTRRRENVRRDVAILLVGFVHDLYFGQADVGETCYGAGYAWAERAHIRTIAHEVGHLLGCSHSTSGIMDTKETDDSFEFSDASVGQIISYVDVYASDSCMRDSRPVKNAAVVLMGSPTPSQSPRGRRQSGAAADDLTGESPSASMAPEEVSDEVGDGARGQRVCGDTFDERTGLGCDEGVLGDLATAAGNVSVTMRQEYGRFSLRLSVAGGMENDTRSTIVRFKNRVSVHGYLTEENMGEKHGLPGNGVTGVDVRWSALNMSLAAGGRQCCGVAMFVYSFVEVLKVGTDSQGGASRVLDSAFGRLHWSVSCKTCEGGKIVAASRVRKCPVCASR